MQSLAEDWLVGRHGGYFAHGISIDGEPRGVYARRAITAGEAILTVPSGVLLTAGAAAAAVVPGTSEVDSIVMMLLTERSRGETSSWAPWLLSLPGYDEFASGMPMLWDQEVTELLRCPAAISCARSQRVAVRARYAALCELLQSADAPPPSWRDYLWAWAIVESRALYLEEASVGAATNCIAPLGDMFNHHASEPSVSALYDRDALGGRGAFTFVASKDVEAGVELCLRYGAHDNTTLLLSYGFVLPPRDNPHARSVLEASERPLLADADAVWLRENDLGDDDLGDDDLGDRDLEEAGPEDGGGKCAPPSAACIRREATWYLTAEGGSFSLLAALRLKHASDEERAAGACFRILEGEPVSDANEARVWGAVRELATSRLERLERPAASETAPAACCLLPAAASETAPAAGPDAGGEAARTRAALGVSTRQAQVAMAQRWRAGQVELLRAACSCAEDALSCGRRGEDALRSKRARLA